MKFGLLRGVLAAAVLLAFSVVRYILERLGVEVIGVGHGPMS